MNSPVSGSREIALMVKSRRRAASSYDRSGIALDREAFMAASGLRLTAGQRDVEAAHLVDRKALADEVDAPERLEEAAKVRGADAEDLEIEILRLRGRGARRERSRRRAARGRRDRGRLRQSRARAPPASR